MGLGLPMVPARVMVVVPVRQGLALMVVPIVLVVVTVAPVVRRQGVPVRTVVLAARLVVWVATA
jgi:hypothetical protein